MLACKPTVPLAKPLRRIDSSVSASPVRLFPNWLQGVLPRHSEAFDAGIPFQAVAVGAHLLLGFFFGNLVSSFFWSAKSPLCHFFLSPLVKMLLSADPLHSFVIMFF